MSAFRKKSSAFILKTVLFTSIWCACCLAAAIIYTAVWPEQSGEEVITESDFSIDSSNAEDGYFMAMHEESGSMLKMRITKGGNTYTYDLNNSGKYEVFPLQMGSGTYTCTLFRHVESNKYAKEAEISIDVELDNEYTPYLGPNQYVYYKQDFKAVEESNLICENLETDIEKYNAIVEYISENFTYDYERAASNPGFYLGDVEGCFETRTGLCQDLAAMTACMLRVQGIPSQLVIGYADKYYHAWNKVLIDGEYQLLDITAEITGVPASVYTEDRHY